MQRKVILFLVLFLLSFMFFAPETALSAAREGLLLWFRTLLPSLLPFMILSNFLISFNCIEKLLSPLRKIWAVLFGLSPCGAYVLLLGTLCGYPMGAKLTATCADRDRSRTGKAVISSPSPAAQVPCFCAPIWYWSVWEPKRFWFLCFSSSTSPHIFAASVSELLRIGFSPENRSLTQKTETSSSYPRVR